MNTDICQLLEQGMTLITPTNRLSRHLQSQYAEMQLSRGKAAWKSADILPWNAWLQRCWEHISLQQQSDLYLLNAYQQQVLWQQTISSSPYAPGLLQSTTTAKQAIEAWNLLQQWQISTFPADLFLNEDAGAFNSWAADYQNKCNNENWFDEARLGQVCSEAIHQGKHKLNQSIGLIGFTEFTPQQQSLLREMKQSGCSVKELAQDKRQGLIRFSGFIDAREEIRAAANWVRQLIEQGDAGSIGIVVPNLQRLRDTIEAEFDDVLMPVAILSAADVERRPFSVSLGQALSGYPLIHSALTLLSLIRQPFALQDISSILRSPFVKSAQSEQQQRARLDAALREHGETYLSLSTLRYIAKSRFGDAQIGTSFFACLDDWITFVQGLPGKQSPVEWAQTFSQLLGTFGWPGERSLNSAEYQTVEAWQQVMKRFASLQLVLPELGYKAALSELRRLTSELSFQPETAEAPIQILGMTGAAEMQFQHLWLMGLHEEIWPQAAQPNPFIPIKLQRERRMPRATAELELDYARNMTRQLLNSSADVVLSYPENEDERSLQPSPLLKAYIEQAELLDIKLESIYAADVLNSRRLESLQDKRAPVIGQGQLVSGGTGLFKDQSLCAFRAFARHRLNARALSEVDIGLDAMDRGSLIHGIMQLFWSRVKSQQSLLELSENELNKIIADCTGRTIDSSREKRPHTFTERFTALELARLNSLVLEWLEQEKSRSGFTVKSCEQAYRFELENIEVRTRIDRVDELADGNQLIVDYKTGKASVGDWFDERPNDPQLPLYAISSESDITGLTFARIKRGEMSYIGLTKDSNVLPKTKAYAESRYAKDMQNWETLFGSWQEILSGLAMDFREGDAQVNPKDANACRYCDLHPLCRIYEKTADIGQDLQDEQDK